MRNIAMKLGVLAKRFNNGLTTQRLLDHPPEEALKLFKSSLPGDVRGVLLFSFNDKALLNILDREIDISSDGQKLVFRKSLLDAESIHLSGGITRVFTDGELQMLTGISSWLVEVTRHLFRKDLSPARLKDTQQEYLAQLKLFVDKNNLHTLDDIQQKLGKITGMKAFTHAMTIDAMYKADAAKLIFGEDSGYHQAWMRKQVFRHMVTRAISEHIHQYDAA